MDHFSHVDQPFAFATVNALGHVCGELLKLHDIDFHDKSLVIEMSKAQLEQSTTIFNLHNSLHQSSGL